MKTKLILAVLCGGYSIAFAQAENEPGEYLKHDLGFNTSIIFQGVFSSSSVPFSLVYKKYTSENKAWRFGLTTALSLTSPTSGNSLNNSAYTTISAVNISTSVGKEWQSMITSKWIFYYGGDIIPGYLYSNIETYSGSNTISISDASTTYSLAARPFLGVRFNINRRLYVSTEFSINLTYRYFTNHSKDYTTDQTADQNLRNVSFALSPASAIFFYYRF